MDDLLVISVAAKPGASFAGYDLLQAIVSTGMKFGEMNIFHYFKDNKKLFSLASATKPGEFDLDRMGAFSCIGLTLFMNCCEVPDAEKAFTLMLNVAEQLADDLDGELRAGLRAPLTKAILQQYQNKIHELCPLPNK
jgi:cell division protein ZipA